MNPQIDERVALCGYFCGDCIQYRSDAARVFVKLSEQIASDDFARDIQVNGECMDSHYKRRVPPVICRSFVPCSIS